MKIGLYFGTFNPIHIGHLIIANYMVDYTEMDQVWLVVSPQNPLKDKRTLLKDHHRLMMVRVAVEDNPKLRASNVEFDLPKPSYTSHTLAYLKEKYPEHDFALIMGEDNLRTFHKWKNYEQILANHTLFVYPRVFQKVEHPSETNPEENIGEHENVRLCMDVPMMNISSSFIRSAVQQGHDVRYLLSEPVFRYLDEMNFYK